MAGAASEAAGARSMLVGAVFDAWADLDRDGYPELAVANWQKPGAMDSVDCQTSSPNADVDTSGPVQPRE